MRSVMSHSFSRVPSISIPRSSFDRTHGYKSTFDSGFLVPFYWDEVLPGDTFNLKATLFARLATPIVPFMDNLFLDTHFFFVANRLLWDHWVNFMGQQDNPDDSTDYLVPQVVAPAGGFTVGSIYDHLGLPTGVAGVSVSALPLRAYNACFNEWLRDENLVDRLPQHKDDGPDPVADYELVRRGKRHDYFTSCLPWPQKGPAVQVPLGSEAPVFSGTPAAPTSPTIYRRSGGSSLVTAGAVTFDSSGRMLDAGPQTSYPSNLFADLTEATSSTINQLRQAFAVQQMLETSARGGSRYTETIRAHFGVHNPDMNWRPEYLGGSSAPIAVNPVAQTSETGTTTPQGNLAGYGRVISHRNGFTKSFLEHGIVIGLVSVRADLTYQQGLDRAWSRRTKLDYYWPAMAHIGEQAVLSREIFSDGSAGDDTVFGYQERYAEYRYKNSKITGLFRSTAPLPLDIWHLSQHFTTRPVLDKTFIEEHPPVNRVVAVTTQPQFLFDSFIRMRCARPMPVYSVPGLRRL